MTQADFLSNAGQRLFPHIVDDVARSNPERSLGVIPKGADVSDGFQEVTAAKLAYAVNVVSWWIENEIGRATQEQTIAYMGSNDIRYLIFILASMKTGYKVGLFRVPCLSKTNNMIVSFSFPRRDSQTKPISTSSKGLIV